MELVGWAGRVDVFFCVDRLVCVGDRGSRHVLVAAKYRLFLPIS